MSKLKAIWNFIWHDDSLLSWFVNVILALVLVKFIIYPGLGLLLATTHPLVAVVSSSMEHDGSSFDEWWEANKGWYEENDISKEDFMNFKLKNGFNKGDIMILRGVKEAKIGDVIVYQSDPAKPPIIHRTIKVNKDSQITYNTKGDHNSGQDPTTVTTIIGKAVFRIPFLGYIKIWFTEIIVIPIMQIFK